MIDSNLNNKMSSDHNLCIVISGGSIRGFGMLGALQYIDEQYNLQTVSSFFGTSVGAIFGYMLCLDLKPLEIIHQIVKSKILEQIRKVQIDGLFSVQQGILDFEPILEELELITLTKYGKVFTLKSLFTELGKEFGCVTVNYTKNKPEYIHHTTTPDLSCLTAVQMSASIPFVFNKCTHNGFIYIDGGFADNFPIRMANYFNKTNIIGICSIPNRQVEHTLSLINVLTLSITDHTRKTMKKFKKRCNIINVPISKNILDFNLDVPIIMEMFSLGYNSAKQKFEKK